MYEAYNSYWLEVIFKFVSVIILVMAIVQRTYNGCGYDYFRFIKNFHSDSANFIEYLKSHGVLPIGVNCGNCNQPYKYHSDLQQCYCSHYIKIAEAKRKKRCNYSVTTVYTKEYFQIKFIFLHRKLVYSLITGCKNFGIWPLLESA